MPPVAVLRLKVNPRSSRDRILGWRGGRLKIAVAAPPEKGRANEAVLQLLSRALGVPVSRIRLVSGLSASEKSAEVLGMADADALSKLPPRRPC